MDLGIVRKHVPPLLKKYRVEIILLSFSLFLVITATLLFIRIEQSTASVNFETQSFESTPSAQVEGENLKSQVVVYIAGAVKNPGVYKLDQGSRLEDLVKKAGGLSAKADTDFFARSFNMAQILTDEEKFYVPTTYEVQKGIVMGVQQTSTSTNSQDSKISVNNADKNSLESLPGVGPVTAEKIINSRPFSSIDELLSKKVVGESVFGKIKELIQL